MLFCKFASPRSTPGRIQRWVEYLTDLEQRNAEDPNAVQTLRNLRYEAFSWLAAPDGRSAQAES